ncbi:histidine--tRNA ligase [Chryseosolibacter indicus]|uniref:Histidine--tRNA ligase n=1 Tax=Chryseosolibacter indicus TaxID=2782351 RepID=A0ABS5VLM0_9BACT|nr:histidine--tRNA ligase [Chryseosolibacter indicus]MBT1702360.1 histidine--tRNA ligase [Chryseosolibacter indicus]
MEKPSLPKGTRDFGPAMMAKRQFIFNNIRTVFQKFGFLPLETPAMENLSTLTGKYGEEGDQLLFKILNSGDFLKDVEDIKLQTKNSKSITFDISEKGLRYDLTVPFARYVVMNRHEISFPFKRYQIQPVWRADRPQKGRYREFYQCDADVVGTNSLLCEAEIILMIKEVFKGLNIQDYAIKINHRGILSGIAEVIGGKGNETALFVAIDKLDKVGEDKVREELQAKGFTAESLNLLFNILNVKGSIVNKMAFLATKFETSTEGQRGLRDLKEVFNILEDYNASQDNVEFDVSLARGLSYYTGCIFEVKINNVSIGSVSGGGRYDNLTQTFGDKENLSGVGFSFGVDRIYDAMEELGLFPKEAQVSSKVLVCHFDEESMRYGLGILKALRDVGISSEIYPDQVKIKKQLDYANKKMIPYTIVIGSDEVKSGLLPLKDMERGEQAKISLEEIIQKIK